MAKQSSSESEDQASYPCHDPTHQHLDEREEQIHTLIHQGMAAMESERLVQADAAFAQALTLARQQQLPQWEAQALFGQGAVLDHTGKYLDAIPLFEQVQAMFALAGRVRKDYDACVLSRSARERTGSCYRQANRSTNVCWTVLRHKETDGNHSSQA